MTVIVYSYTHQLSYFSEIILSLLADVAILKNALQKMSLMNVLPA